MEHVAIHTFAMKPADFWERFFYDEDFVRAFHDAVDLDLTHYEVRRDGDRVVRTLHYVPRWSMPGFVSRLLRGARSVTERSIWDTAANRVRVEIDLPVVGQRVDFDAGFESEETADGGCRRTWTAKVKVRVPVVGKRIERYIVRQIDKTLETFACFATERLVPKGPVSAG